MLIGGKVVVFAVAITTLVTFTNAFSISGHESEFRLLNYMARANDLLQQDPTRSLNCFNKYIPLINAIASNYETNYQTCLNQSTSASAEADEATLGQRNDLANAADASCALLKQCQEDNSVEGIFQCYIESGSASIQTMYTINVNASQELAALREQYYLIKNAEFKCTNDTKRAYEKESAEAYAGLNNCILGNAEIITATTAAVTTTEAPTEPTAGTTPVQSETSDTTEVIPESTTAETPAEPSDDTAENPLSTTTIAE